MTFVTRGKIQLVGAQTMPTVHCNEYVRARRGNRTLEVREKHRMPSGDQFYCNDALKDTKTKEMKTITITATLY